MCFWLEFGVHGKQAERAGEGKRHRGQIFGVFFPVSGHHFNRVVSGKLMLPLWPVPATYAMRSKLIAVYRPKGSHGHPNATRRTGKEHHKGAIQTQNITVNYSVKMFMSIKQNSQLKLYMFALLCNISANLCSQAIYSLFTFVTCNDFMCLVCSYRYNVGNDTILNTSMRLDSKISSAQYPNIKRTRSPSIR